MSRLLKEARIDWLRAVGEAIRLARTNTGLSQEALGYKAGLHRTYVSDVERGQRNPTVVTILALARTMGITSSDLLKSAEQILAAQRSVEE